MCPERTSCGSRRDLVVADLTRRARARLVVKPVHAIAGEPPAPHTCGVRANVEFGCDLIIGQPVRCGQNNARSHGQRLRRAMFAGQRRQCPLLSLVQYNRDRSPLRHSRPQCSKLSENVTDLPIGTLGSYCRLTGAFWGRTATPSRDASWNLASAMSLTYLQMEPVPSE
jgi:hypothetical protein